VSGFSGHILCTKLCKNHLPEDKKRNKKGIFVKTSPGKKTGGITTGRHLKRTDHRSTSRTNRDSISPLSGHQPAQQYRKITTNQKNLTKMKAEPIEIRSYKCNELAMLYCPFISPDSASRQLRRWINRNPALTAALKAQGWQKGNRTFTPAQVEVIIQYLGMPQRIMR